MTGIVADALDIYVRGSFKPFLTDRMSTVGASEIGQCARKVFWIKNEDDARLHAPRDEEYIDTWGARLRGSTFEERLWVPAMRKRFGRRLKYAGKSQRTFVDNYLSATPDAIVTDLTEAEKQAIGTDASCALFECKTLDPRATLTEAKAENIYQTHVQMGILHATTDLRPTHAVISYADASFWNEVKEFVVAYDPDIYAAAQQRAAVIMTSTNVEEVAPEGWIAGGTECRYCPFTKPCGVQRRNLPFADNDQPVDPQFAAEITDLARELKAAEGQGKTYEAHVRDLQDTIKNRLREKGIRKVPGVVTWSPVKGRSGYDNKALQAAAVAAGVDIGQFATQGEPGDRLVITIAE
jgi:hypothetical protein